MLTRAKRLGARTVLNMAPAASVPPEVLGALDVLVVNEIEAETVAGVTGQPPETVARALATTYGLTCVVTLGGAGCIAVTAAEGWRVPVLPITPVDTTGAGDAFVGVLTAWLDGGADLVEVPARRQRRRRLQLRAGRRPDRPAAAGGRSWPACPSCRRSPRCDPNGSIHGGRGRVTCPEPVPPEGMPCSIAARSPPVRCSCRSWPPRGPPGPTIPPRSSRSTATARRSGTTRLRFSRDGERLTVDIDILLEVKLAFITLYRYRHTNRELWEAGRLLSFASRTDDNGTAHRVAARRAGEVILVESDQGRVEAPGDATAQHLLAPPFPRCAGLDRHPGRPAPALQGHAHAA